MVFSISFTNLIRGSAKLNCKQIQKNFLVLKKRESRLIIVKSRQNSRVKRQKLTVFPQITHMHAMVSSHCQKSRFFVSKLFQKIERLEMFFKIIGLILWTNFDPILDQFLAFSDSMSQIFSIQVYFQRDQRLKMLMFEDSHFMLKFVCGRRQESQSITVNYCSIV